jgi:signal transduction histidine kinase
MFRDFLTSNRSELISLCRTRVARRRAPRATPAELEHGIPLFLDQLTEMFPGGSSYVAEPSDPQGRPTSAEAQIGDTATLHGSELLRHDFTIDQVVHDYGDLCQSITELAFEQHAAITVEEFGMLNSRLDNAIAVAVTEYARQREIVRTDAGALATNERLGGVAYEMRNLLNTAILALAAIKGGGVGFGGATAAALDRSLISMRGLIDRTLAEVRLESGAAASRQLIEIGPFFLEVQVAAALEASTKGCELTVMPVEPGMFVEADRHILAAALANLLQNAFKFTSKDTHVLLRAYAHNARVLIEVEDESGGLPDGVVEQLFRAFDDGDADRSGAGLALSISRKGVDANGGKLYMKNVPGRGCVFTIDLPQKAHASSALSESRLETAAP